MVVADLTWHWADASARSASFGLVHASEAPREPSTVVMWGVLGDRRSSSALECSLQLADSTRTTAWVAAVVEALPLGTGSAGLSQLSFYQRRFGRAPPQPTLPWGNASSLPASVQMRCDLGTPVAGHRLSVRSSLAGADWRLDGVLVHPATWSMHQAAGGTRGGPSLSGAAAAEGAPPPVSITACVGYVFADATGHAPSAAALFEWAAWYALLGATRLVIFDDMDDESHPTAAALRALAALPSWSGALPVAPGGGATTSVVVVRGLCLRDTMLRASMHANCQVLANNLCRHFARADAPPSVVVAADLDEFMAPATPAGVPLSHAAREDTAKGLLPLRGALARLASSRPTGSGVGQQGRSAHVCLKMANVAYLPPACDEAGDGSGRAVAPSAAAERDIGVGAKVLRMTARGQPDSFEIGPSSQWGLARSWGAPVRAKWMASAAAGDKDVVSIHHCCQPMLTEQRKKDKTEKKDNKAKASPCDLVESLPIESWHVRHFRGGDGGPDGAGSGQACRARDAPPVRARLVSRAGSDNGNDNGNTDGADSKGDSVALNASHWEGAPLPPAWAHEYAEALGRLAGFARGPGPGPPSPQQQRQPSVPASGAAAQQDTPGGIKRDACEGEAASGAAIQRVLAGPPAGGSGADGDASTAVVFQDGSGRFGNDLFRYAAAFGVACAANASLRPRRDGLRVCRVFPGALGCAAPAVEPHLKHHKGGDVRGALAASEQAHKSSGGTVSRAAPSYFEIAPEERRVVWRPVAWWPLHRGGLNLVSGYRQSPAYFAACEGARGVPLRAQLRFEASMARAATELRATAVGDDALCVSLFHRAGDGYSEPGNPYHDCLPDANYYARVMPRAATDVMHKRGGGGGSGGGSGGRSSDGGRSRLVFLVSSYGSSAEERARLFSRGADAARAALRGSGVEVSVAAIDHERPEVAMATHASCSGASWSHGSFSWWVAYLTDGFVYYDAGLRQRGRHPLCAQAFGFAGEGCSDDARAYVKATVLPTWVAI